MWNVRIWMRLSIVAVLLAAGASRAAADDPNVEEYNSAMETLQTYATQITEAKTKLTLVYISALANFETTVQQASPTEAKADVVGAALKSAWGTAKGAATKGIQEATGVDIAPLVALYEAVDGEIDRAAAAGASLKAGEWIKTLRSTLTDNYAKDNSGAYLQQLKDYYRDLPVEDKFDWITSVQVELEALKNFAPPTTDSIEMTMYEGWLYGLYTHCNGKPDPSYGGTLNGVIRIMFDEGDNGPVLEAVCVKSPLGARIQGGIDRLLKSNSVMSLNAMKQVCFYGDNIIGGKEYECGCMDKANRIVSHLDPPYDKLFEGRSWVSQVNGFYGDRDKCE